MQDVTAQVDELCETLGHSLPREIVMQSLQGADFNTERALLRLVELVPDVISHDTGGDAILVLVLCAPWSVGRVIGAVKDAGGGVHDGVGHIGIAAQDHAAGLDDGPSH